MSATAIDHHLAETGPSDHPKLERLGPGAGLLGLVGTATSVALILNPGTRQAMLGSYLFGWVFWIGLTLGCFGLALLYYTVRGSWALPMIRLWEAGGSAMSFFCMGLLFLPILAFMPALYEWANPASATGKHAAMIAHKAPYLNLGGFIVRLVIFLALWAGMSYGMRDSAWRQDKSREFRLESGRSSWGAAGMVMFILTITFAFTDWVMSIDVTWYSTIYGVWLGVAATLGALALTAVVVCVNKDREPYRSVVTPNLTKDIGNMLFVLTMLWGYTSLSQFLIIWNGNLPAFASYYHTRSLFGWNAIGMALILGQFVLPFMWLLAPRAKRVPELLAKIAGWIFVVHIIDVYMVVAPSLPTGNAAHPRVPGTNLLFDLVALLGVGGIWLLAFASQVGKAPLMPLYDNRLQEAKKHAH